MDRRQVTSRIDDLRLLALSRIPRCKACPRFRALREARRMPATSPSLLAVLPAVPAHCRHEVCAPIAERYRDGASRRTVGGPLRVVGTSDREVIQ